MNERRKGIDPTRTLILLDTWAAIGAIGRIACIIAIILCFVWSLQAIYQMVNWFRLLLG
jgi:hypothetical protein